MATVLKRIAIVSGILASLTMLVFFASCAIVLHKPRPVEAPPAPPARNPQEMPMRVPLPVCPDYPVNYDCRKLSAGEIGGGSRGNQISNSPSTP